jgi:alpha-D-ribose 1-methylphosphonate 5-triphosphate diphosphatase
MSRLYITHASIVLADTVLHDSALLIEDGVIAAIEPGATGGCPELDLQGQILMPGMIDVHCDAIEKEAEPRSRVLFPLDFACAQVDRRNAAAGITTPYHAISFSNNEWGVRNNETAATLIRTLVGLRPASLVDNRIHCRYEITDAHALPVVAMLMEEGMVDLLSVMDHSPGQGQFKTMDAYLDYLTGNRGISREEAHAVARHKLDNQTGALQRVERLLEQAHGLGIPTASHDDDSVQRIKSMRALGVSMSEFPINMETARAAVDAGLPTILGAPNVLRGGSQSGSMRAIDAIEAGVASCLCSDYQPSALVAAAFKAADLAGISLSQASALVAANPARACGLDDRGVIAVGRRADLIAVAHVGRHSAQTLPLVSHTWSAGRLVFAAHYPDASVSVHASAAAAAEIQAA